MDKDYEKVKQEVRKGFSKFLKKAQISPLPWRMEQDSKTDDFEIFDRDYRLVASGISNEGDAILIVNLVNCLAGD